MSKNADSIQRFLFEEHDVRGAIVHLNESFKTILAQHPYPPALQHLLGETLLAAVMLSNSIKYPGRLTIQFQSKGPVKMLVAKCNHLGQIRALAQWQKEVMDDQILASFGEGELVITVDPDETVRPYQSIVPLHQQTVSQALEHYFMQSEQLSAKFMTHVEGTHAAGVMLQAMPKNGDVVDETDTFWQQATEVLQRSSAKRLLISANSNWLRSVYSDEEIRLFDSQPIEFKCNCSISRMEDAIKTFGKTETENILAEKQQVVVTCEYCGNEFGFDREDVDRIFTPKKH